VRESFVTRLVDPLDGGPLTLHVDRSVSGDIVEGRLTRDGRNYQIRDGVPRFVLTEDADQRQTEESFGFKWQQTSTYDAPGMREVSRTWLVQRYGFQSAEQMQSYLASRGTVLDAGCGSGFSSSLWLSPQWSGEWIGADISVAIDVARRRLGHIPRTEFVQADVLQLPFPPGTFDAVFSEGVLHHTPSTERALKGLVPLLKRGGELLIYVYRRKGPVREFTDDFIRDRISGLAPEEAWAQLRPLTRFGQALAELRAEVEIPEDVPLIGLKAGRYDVQRLVYWHFVKCFWNPAFSFEENTHVNFDWYHPRYAHRHTAGDLQSWCADAGVRITHFDEQDSGFTLRGLKE
jgi:SAM-dependent methyltransferase